MESRRFTYFTIATVAACLVLVVCFVVTHQDTYYQPFVQSEPGNLNVDILILIYSHSSSGDLRRASDERFRIFPLSDPENPHVRVWKDRSSGAELTFTYFFTVGNDTLVAGFNESASDVRPSLPPHLDLETRVLTMQIPSNYRALKHRTKAVMTARHHLLFPNWFPEPNFELLLRLDDDTFPCLNLMFHKLIAQAHFERNPAGIARALTHNKADPNFLWGGPWINATVLTWWRHRWYDGEYLAEVGWRKGLPPVQYPGQYPAGFAMFAGRRFLGRLEEARDRLKVYGVDDAMIGIWVHRTLGLKEDQDWYPFTIRSDNEMCHCSQDGWKPTEKVEFDVWHECKLYQQHVQCLANLGPGCLWGVDDTD